MQIPQSFKQIKCVKKKKKWTCLHLSQRIAFFILIFQAYIKRPTKAPNLLRAWRVLGSSGPKGHIDTCTFKLGASILKRYRVFFVTGAPPKKLKYGKPSDFQI